MWLGSLETEADSNLSLQKVFEDAGWEVKGKKKFDSVNELMMFQQNNSKGHKENLEGIKEDKFPAAPAGTPGQTRP